MSSPDPDQLLTSANSSTLAGMKRDWLDPQLRGLGLDPGRYELAYEMPPADGDPPHSVESEVREGVFRMIAEEALLKIADALDIPPEIISANLDVNWVAATDPYNMRAFEQARREYAPHWRYVSGGKALHAFIGDSDRPVCGIDPRRGPDRHPARWHEGDPNRRSPWMSGPHTEHGPCLKAVRAHQWAMVHRASLETL